MEAKTGKRNFFIQESVDSASGNVRIVPSHEFWQQVQIEILSTRKVPREK